MLGQRGCGHVGLHTNRHRHTAALHVAQSLGQHRAIGIVQTEATVVDGLAQTQPTHVAHLLEDLVRRKNTSRFPIVHMRVDLFIDPALHRALQFMVFVAEFHGRATENCMAWG